MAKLKTAKEPLAKVDAITVITSRLIWEIARLKVRGIIIAPISADIFSAPIENRHISVAERQHGRHLYGHMEKSPEHHPPGQPVHSRARR